MGPLHNAFPWNTALTGDRRRRVQGHMLQETLSWESKANEQTTKALGRLPVAALVDFHLVDETALVDMYMLLRVHSLTQH